MLDVLIRPPVVVAVVAIAEFAEQPPAGSAYRGILAYTLHHPTRHRPQRPQLQIVSHFMKTTERIATI